MFRRLALIAALIGAVCGSATFASAAPPKPAPKVSAAAAVSTAPAVRASASARVNITVSAIAQVDLPNGANFILHVPNTPHCSPYRDRDRNYNSNYRNRHDDWDDWKDSDWDNWNDGHSWDDWDENDWQHHGKWYSRCGRWLSDKYWPVIRPVRIPFTVVGNATASVTVRPSQYLKIKSGKYYGKATGTAGRTLAYQTITHFPAPSRTYGWLSGWEFYNDWDGWHSWGGFGSLPSWSRWAKLPGTNNAGTPPLTANMVARSGKAWGVIYIVARRDWTTTGKNATPGDYSGTVVLTIVADNL